MKYQNMVIFNPYNFQSLEVVSRYRDPQLQVTKYVCDWGNFTPTLYECFKISNLFYF